MNQAEGYDVRRYAGGSDSEIAALILGIQNDEVGVNLTIEEQPDLLDIVSSYANGGFWVARRRERIVGTIGLSRYGDRGALKKFFIAREHRARSGPAKLLFDELVREARTLGLRAIFLDTPSVATRAHAFYTRMGFVAVGRETLPASYTFPDRDCLIFECRL